jgi:hypothetical protein
MTWADETVDTATAAPDAVSAENDTDPVPWEFRVTPFGWAPTDINFHVKDGDVNEHLNISLDELANTMKGVAELRGEVRKGKIGSFVSFMYIELNGETGNRVWISREILLYGHPNVFEKIEKGINLGSACQSRHWCRSHAAPVSILSTI